MAVAEISRTAIRVRRVRPWLRWLLGAVIVIELATWYALLASGGWSFDDNLLLEQARVEGFSWAFLGGSTFGHWGIGYPAIYSFFNHLMPVDYRWGLLLMLVELGVAMVLLTRVMELLFGRGLIPLLSAAYLGISVLLIRSLQWPAQGFQTFPTLIFDLLCLWAYLRYQRDPRLRWIVVSAGAIFVGLLFYEKPIFMIFYLFVLRALVLDDTTRPRTVIKAIWQERRMWLAYATVLVIYGVAREAANAGNAAGAPFSTIGELWRGLWLMWGHALVPQLLGWARPTDHLNTLELVGVVVLQVLVAGLVAISVWRKRSAWRAWTALGLFVIATWLLVELTRVGSNGLVVVTDQRYLFDFVWLAPLLVCLAFSRQGSFIPRPAAPANTPHRLLRPVAVLLMLAYAGVSVAAIANWQSLWLGRAARTWELNLENGLARLDRAGVTATVADNFVPSFMIQTSYVPWSYLSYVAPEYGGHVNVNGPLVGKLFVVDPAGSPRPAHVARVWYRTRLHSRCSGPTSTAPVQIEQKIRTRLDPGAAPYYVRIGYSSGGVAQLPLYVSNDGIGYPGLPNRLVSIAQGTGQSLAWLGAGAPRGLILNTPPYVCLRDLAIITLAMN